MKKRDKTIIAGAAAAVAVAGAGAAIAGTGALSPEDRSKAVIDDAAKELGVEPSELSDALKHALENRIDEAVQAGRLTEAQGKALKERIESSDVPLVFGGIGPGDRPGVGHFGHFGLVGVLETAASYLGIEEDDLREALADGKSLAEVAKAEGKSVDGLVDALVADAKKRLDAAVDDGRLTKEQATELEEDLRERVTGFVNREPGESPRFGERRFGPGSGGLERHAWPSPGEHQDFHRPGA
jgi:hypothetical protein